MQLSGESRLLGIVTGAYSTSAILSPTVIDSIRIEGLEVLRLAYRR